MTAEWTLPTEVRFLTLAEVIAMATSALACCRR